MNQVENLRFRVSVTDLKRGPAIGPTGSWGQDVRFHAESLNSGPSFDYEGYAMGNEFLIACQRLIELKSIVVEVPESMRSLHIDTWKEDLVNFALAKAATNI
jgi:hypothetical protein